MAEGCVAEITLISPSIIPTATPCQVEVHVDFNDADGDEKMDLVRRENGREWIMKEIENSTDIIEVEVDSDGHGTIEIFIQSKDGRVLSSTASIVSAPQSVAEDLTRVFQCSIVGIMDAVRAGSFGDATLTIEQLEESPVLAMKTTWQNHFRHLVVDLGELMDQMSSCGDAAGRAVGNPARDYFRTKLNGLLKFLTANAAYDAGNFLLLSAAASGETITLDGTPLEIDQLDLRKLQQNC